MTDLILREIVCVLDRFIIGRFDAKPIVALADLAEHLRCRLSGHAQVTTARMATPDHR